MADLMQPDREFGITLAAGEVVGPGTLVKVDSSGTGAVTNKNGPVHGYSLSSGAGTKTVGIPQRVLLKRHGILKFPSGGFTKGNTLYATTAGNVVTSGAGLFYKVGFALDTDVAFIDLDLEQI